MAKETVREAFLEQARFCDHLGSPLTAQLMRALPEALEAGGPVADRVWTWPGQPDAKADSVPLRLGGVLHRLVRAGEVPALAALYPPSDLPGMEVLKPVLAEVLDSHSAQILDGLTFAPQTNEVGRASALYAGLLTIAAEYPQPFALYEVGASAGLNLMADRFGYRFGEAAFGDPASPVQLTPAWSGPVPPRGPVQVVSRRGCDLNPLDLTDPAARARLLSFVWADQPERLSRAEAAVSLAQTDVPAVDRADAADWVEAQFAGPGLAGVTRVLWHSIAAQYFPQDSRDRIDAALATAGEAATAERPVARLALEQAADERGPALTLTLWPGGREVTLARASAHVTRVDWLAS
ncbi:MAG: DUF2332 domain-containing protein [Pseudomonadota bacterium]